MPLIEWTEKLSVGLDEIDKQHKKWIDIVNRLHDSIMASEEIETLKGVITEMEEYTDFHFSTEEEMLEKEGYPDIDRHKRIHFAFTQEVKRLKRETMSGELVLRSQVMSVIKNWLEDHILKEDMEYGNFIRKKP